MQPIANFRTICLALALAGAATADPSPAQVGRAEKISGTLELRHEVRLRVGALIAGFYADLDQLQAEKGTEAKQQELRDAFFTRLGTDLTPAQIEQVKNGLTYNVLPNLWKIYQEMLPNLTEEQKEKILGWLTEARDLAITAGSAAKKHGCFDESKGRITNYLSAAGIDMKQAEREMFARRKQAAAP